MGRARGCCSGGEGSRDVVSIKRMAHRPGLLVLCLILDSTDSIVAHDIPKKALWSSFGDFPEMCWFVFFTQPLLCCSPTSGSELR